MARYSASDALVATELDRMRTCRIGATANRSVVGTMTEFSFLADTRRARTRQGHHFELLYASRIEAGRLSAGILCSANRRSLAA
jgi:hypothetical protein